MPQQIEVPGLGVVEFPDGMSDDQISAAIRSNMPPSPKGYGENLTEMATESAGQLGRGVGQLHNAWDFVRSGAGRNLVPDTPAGRVASGFSALNSQSPQVFTEGEHRIANRQAIGDAVRGFGNTVFGAMGAAYSPLNAALRTYVGQPVESATGSQAAGTAAEIATGLFGPSVVSRGARAVGRNMAAKPSFEEIDSAATAGFRSPAVRDLEVQPNAVQAWSNRLRTDLTDSGRSDVTAKQTWSILNRLDKAPPGATMSGNNLASIRRELQEVAQEVGPNFRPTTDASAATQAIRSLDGFVAGGMRPSDVIRGDPAAAARNWAEARGNYAQAAKIRSVDRRQLDAETGASSANSGLNFDNTMRQKMRDVVTRPAGRGFTQPGEREAVERVVFGSPERNALRRTSQVLGGGGGIGATAVGALGTAATAGSGVPFWGAAAPFFGMGLRKVENALTARDMDRLNAVLRANSPLARQAGGARQDVARALIGADLPPWVQNAIALQLLARPTPLASK